MQKRFSKIALGFTLIELLVTVAILGILASFAISNYDQYRKRSYYVAMMSDAKSYITSQEAYYIDNETYYADNCTATSCDLPGMNLSPGSCFVSMAVLDSYAGFFFNEKIFDMSLEINQYGFPTPPYPAEDKVGENLFWSPTSLSSYGVGSCAEL
jgi:prepilin-type N-terminal cleavage/methylation domain-containing protein